MSTRKKEGEREKETKGGEKARSQHKSNKQEKRTGNFMEQREKRDNNKESNERGRGGESEQREQKVLVARGEEEERGKISSVALCAAPADWPEHK
jgi:hypothetical protein